MNNKLLKTELKIINMGLRSFAENLKNENVKTVHLNWAPPAGGNPRMLDLLRRYKNLLNQSS